VAGGAVNMNVKHSGREESAGQVVMLGVLRETVAAGAEAVDEAVFNEQPWVGQNTFRQQQGSGGQQTTHADSFVR
jgi:hypothetical protein